MRPSSTGSHQQTHILRLPKVVCSLSVMDTLLLSYLLSLSLIFSLSSPAASISTSSLPPSVFMLSTVRPWAGTSLSAKPDLDVCLMAREALSLVQIIPLFPPSPCNRIIPFCHARWQSKLWLISIYFWHSYFRHCDAAATMNHLRRIRRRQRREFCIMQNGAYLQLLLDRLDANIKMYSHYPKHQKKGEVRGWMITSLWGELNKKLAVNQDCLPCILVSLSSAALTLCKSARWNLFMMMWNNLLTCRKQMLYS